MLEIYFDNAATTRVDDAVIAQMTDVMKNEYGNPSSLHSRGVAAELRMERAAHQVETALGMKEGKLFFTSGGTESNNLAILGTAEALRRRGNRVILSSMEHASVLGCGKELRRRGFDVVELPADQNGRVSLSALEEALNAQTILVSMMLVNNEVGTIQPVREAAKLISVDGVYPSPETIADGSYPYTTAYYAVIRADEPEDSPARALLNWTLSDDGQNAAKEAGYVPLK